MAYKSKEYTIEELINYLNDLMYISKFVKDKDKIKEDRKVIKKMISDLKKNKYEKYFTDEDNLYG